MHNCTWLYRHISGSRHLPLMFKWKNRLPWRRAGPWMRRRRVSVSRASWSWCWCRAAWTACWSRSLARASTRSSAARSRCPRPEQYHKKVKVKAAHTRLPSVGFRSWSRHEQYDSTRYLFACAQSSFIQRITLSRSNYTRGEVTSQSLWSRYDRHFVGITRHNALS